MIKAHGILMGMAFVIISPLALLAMRSGSWLGSRAFTAHWMLQATTIALAGSGAVIGWLMAGGGPFGSPHQGLGSTVIGLMVVQAILGWGHHRIYLRLKRRTWISYAHIGLGCVITLGSWGNLLVGTIGAGYDRVVVSVLASVISLEAVAIGINSWLARRRAAAKEKMSRRGGDSVAPKPSSAEYFSVELDEEDYTSDEEAPLRRSMGEKKLAD
ncbi:hypothetical protein BX600DRAFT_469714 [Xylariales sp. PMI_506]|nr:hypothetical protein BX600DRAFT_469714 [Xylariales sp. PMI_506]